MSPEGEGGQDKLKLEFPANKTVNQDDINLAEHVAKSGTALERIRKNAADWRTGLAGLLTIVTTALVFKAPEKISAYAEPLPVILTLTAVAAAIAGVLGMWLLLLAAHGDIRKVTREEIAEKGGPEGWMQSITEKAARHFRLGRGLTALSAALVGGLIAVAWVLPESPDDPPAFVRVTEMGGEPAQCGTLQVADAKGVTFKVKEERDPKTVTFDKLKSVVLVDKC